MQLKVRLATGELGEIEAQLQDRVDNIRERAKSLFKYPVERVGLWALDCELKDGHTLNEYSEHLGSEFQYGVIMIPDFRSSDVDFLETLTISLKKKLRLDNIPTSEREYESEEANIAKLKSLLERSYTDFEACSLFTELATSRALHDYIDEIPKYQKKLFEMAKSVLACMKAVSRDIQQFIRSTRRKQPEEAEKVLSSSPLVKLFAHALMREDESDWSYNFSEWTRLLEESIEVLNPPPKPPSRPVTISEENFAHFQSSLSISRECNDKNFIRLIPEHIRRVASADKKDVKADGIVPKVDDSAGPFVFICAPSGCGKTTFAYNLACNEFPTLYFVFASNWIEPQPAYVPFKDLSLGLMHLLLGPGSID